MATRKAKPKPETGELNMPSEKKELGASYNYRAKLGADSELTFTGFFRYNVTLAEVNSALDLLAHAVKRQQAISEMDRMEMGLEQSKVQIKRMQDDVGRIPAVRENMAPKLANDIREQHESKAKAIAEAKMVLDFNTRKHAEYKRLIQGEPLLAAAE